MWLNGQVISPVPDQSPSHRHRRADRAEAPDLAAFDSEPLPPFAPAPVPGLVGPIRRKVGFELELGLDLAKGRVLSAPTTSAKSKQPSKEYASSGRPLRAETDWLLESSEEDEPQSGMQRSKDQTITKGETIRSGAGWRLTPDGGDGNWYPEFITDPVDEDKQPDRLPQIMQQLGTTVTKEWSDLRPGQYLDQGRGFVIGWAPQQRRKGLAANIHITVGVRPDRLIDLMGTLVQLAGGTKGKKKKLQPSLDENADDGAPSLAIDRSTLQILDRAVQQGQSAPGDPVYQGLVALMGTYVAGELRILDRLDDVIYELKPYGFHRLIDAADLREFLLTGTITNAESLGFIVKSHRTFDAFAKELREHLAEMGPAAAKLNVPILSRSSLAELRKATTIAAFGPFLDHVLAAAGRTSQESTLPLFPLGIANPKRTRTIEAQPTITIEQWVKSVFDGRNLTFTDETKSFESVGPVLGTCLCFWETRADGAVIEIRALDGDRPVEPARWDGLAKDVVGMMRSLNDTS